MPSRAYAFAFAIALIVGAARAEAQGGAVVPGDVGSSTTPPPPRVEPPAMPGDAVDTSEIVGGAVDSATEADLSDGRGLQAEAGEDEDDDEDGAETEEDARGEDVVATLGTVVGTAGAPPPVDLEAQHRIVWREDWPRYSFDEAVLSLGMGALLVAAELLPTATTSANWTGGILFDEPVRQGLRLQLPEARDSARVASEVIQWVLIASPFVIDALGAVGIAEGNWDAAFQMGLIALESYVISLVVWKVTVLLARRERPVATRCADDAEVSAECNEPFETTSFFSNQTMNAFTGASLMCLHHTHMPLFGDEAADASACVVAMTAASVVGLLRVMSDREYLTDVLMGGAVGFLAGYIVPWILHYQGGARPELRPPVALIPAPMVGPGETYGMQVAGWF